MINIEVKQEHIDRALELTRDSEYSYTTVCPIALAVKFYFGDVSVGTKDFYRLNIGGNSIPLPQTVIDAILAFDTYKTVIPFSFELLE